MAAPMGRPHRDEITAAEVRAEVEARLRVLESTLGSRVRTPPEMGDPDARDEMASALVRLRSLEQRYRVQERR